MIPRVALLAVRELRELSRQGAMIGVLAALMGTIGLLSATAAGLLQVVAADPRSTEVFAGWLAGVGLGVPDLSALLGTVVALANFLLFTQYLGLASVLSGHTLLHDRQCGTLPFLLLAPVARGELLLGKVVGAVALPTGLYAAVALASLGIVRALPLAHAHTHALPPAPAWLVAAFVGAPVWAVAVGLICATLSALARDVRTAQQGVWFVMFFATFAAGGLLTGRLQDGVLVQLVVLALGLVLGAGALLVGTRVISRDLAR